MRPLGVIPTYMSAPLDLKLTARAIESFIDTAGDVADLLVVDDGSPRRDLVERLAHDIAVADGVELVAKDENEGFARTVNVGLAQARDEGRDAVLVNADVEFVERGWLEALGNTEAYVAGGLLLFPTGLVQHAGVYYSVLHRTFDHIYRFAPGTLPEAHVRRVCPVTGALQLIRNEALNFVGLYDEGFRMGWEDVDYCLRVFKMGRECVYEPDCRAIHHEQMFRGSGSDKMLEWQRESMAYLYSKHAGSSFAEHVPTLLEG